MTKSDEFQSIGRLFREHGGDEFIDVKDITEAMSNLQKENPELFQSQKQGIEAMLADPEQAELAAAVVAEMIEMYNPDQQSDEEE